MLRFDTLAQLGLKSS